VKVGFDKLLWQLPNLTFIVPGLALDFGDAKAGMLQFNGEGIGN